MVEADRSTKAVQRAANLRQVAQERRELIAATRQRLGAMRVRLDEQAARIELLLSESVSAPGAVADDDPHRQSEQQR